MVALVIEWLAFVNINCLHLKRGSCCKLNAEAQMTTPADCFTTPPRGGESGRAFSQFFHTASPVSPPRGFEDSTHLQRMPLDSSWDQAHLSKNISAKVCLF